MSSAFVLASLQPCFLAARFVHPHPLVFSFPRTEQSNSVRVGAQAALRMSEFANEDVGSQPPWLQGFEVSGCTGEHIEQVSSLRTYGNDAESRMAYLTELDKAAKGISKVITVTVQNEQLQASGIRLPLPDRHNSQELQNMHEMVQMGMMTAETFENALASKRTQALAGRAVVGAVDVTLYMLADVQFAYFSNMIVREECRGVGLGSLLLSKAEELAKESKADQGTLHVHATNAIAVGLYERAGFSRVASQADLEAHGRGIQALIDVDLSDLQNVLMSKKLL